MKKWVGRLDVIKVSHLPTSANKEKILNYYRKANGQEYFEELYLGAGETYSIIYQEGIKL